MPYRRPGVTVTQEFVGLVPALAGFNLPSVVVGPAYQIVNDDPIGIYAGSQNAFAYNSLLGGATVDVEEVAPDELFPASKKPISLIMRNAVQEAAASSAVGSVAGTAFSDVTATRFATILPGDLLRIVASLAVAVLAAQTNGVSTDTVGQRNRLTAGVAGQFADVKDGDTVTVTGGTNTNAGAFTVSAKISDDLLLLSADVNDGVGASVDVAYSIAGDRGVANAGDHRILTVTDDNNVVLESPLPDAESLISYIVIREVASVTIPRVATLVENGFVADVNSITLPGSGVLSFGGLPLIEGDLEAGYRALRIDFASAVQEFKNIDDIDAAFGTGQITPANPLAFGLQVMLQNTVTAVNGLGLSADFLTSEVTAFVKATDALALTEMYAISVLSHSPVVHVTFKNHVDQLSLPGKKKERVALINSLLTLQSVLQEESTTSLTLVGSRTVIGTQVDGEANVASDTVLTDLTANQFANVEEGDQVTILAGTNAVLGTFSVASVDDVNNLTLSGVIISAGVSSDFQYIVQRHDGLDVGGLTVYDRNANFIADGVAAGHYVEIVTPTGVAGRFLVGNVVSGVELTLATAIAGVVTSQNPLTYEVNRDFSKAELAENVKGYSESIGSRRVAHCWPDIVDMPVGSDVEPLPGYYLGCSVAALTTGLPTQQGFTNLGVGGFLGFQHSTGFFDDDQLDVIADGGTMIFAQDGPSQPLFIRHQLTTDRSAIKFQEYSVTKNVDFIAKFLRGNFVKFIGLYNIIDTTLDDLKTTATSSVKFLKEKTVQPKIGGVIRGGSLASLVEDDTQIDTILMRFKFNIPIPLNNLEITIEV